MARTDKSLDAALKFHRDWFRGDPHEPTVDDTIELKDGDIGVLIGKMVQIVYRSKRTGELVDWDHEFESNDINLVWFPTSEIIVIAGPGLEVTAAGMETGIKG